MGLGPFPAVSLAQARNLAAEARSLAKAGQDPIAARDAQRTRQRLEEARGVTFDQATEQFLDDHESTWRNAKHRQQWRNTLRTYASPTMGSLSVAAIGTSEVTRVLDPIWKRKPETASRLRGRVERILDWAKVRGYRDGENPARWRGHLDKVFPARSQVRRVRHHAAVPIDDVPAVYAKLRKANGMAALALRFVMLTAGRPGEITGAAWPEVDQRSAVWTVPGTRMKAGHDHRVTLSREALAVLKDAAELRVDRWVFPGGRRGKPLSLTSLTKALNGVDGMGATVHGFRSTFKDWASERTSFPSEVSEMALAHAISDKVEAAYRRGELIHKRAAMMEQWARFLLNPPSANVVPIGRRRRA
jgi:integrase